MPSLPPLSRLRSIRRRWQAAGLVVVVGLGVGGWFLLKPDSTNTPTSITETVARGTYKTTVSATGTITPKKSSDLAFTSSGTVTEVLVAAGDTVEKGDVLAKIDDTALIAQRDAASAQLSAARTQLSEDSGSSSSQISADEASVAAAESSLTQAQDAVDNATLRAPFTGTVSAVGYSVGDVAGSGGNQPAADSSSSSSSGITVITPRKLLVEANVSSSDVSQLKTGMQAEITPTGGGDAVYGTVTEIGKIASASNSGAAQFPVTITVTGTPSGLYPGSSATVAITVKQATNVLAVPTQALHTDNGSTYVYVVKNGKRTKTTVTVGTAYGAQTEVKSGLKEGDTVEVINFRAGGGGNAPGGGLFQRNGNNGSNGNGPTFSGTFPGGQAPQFVGGQ
ncbi:efflux RND transporter periplasmic adaptor subunit [Nocardioides marmorisolisilvae]|nr:efflux RND transporter periplasmic adaptor subunit [Nocardioides marmorisolisilvae]